MHKSKERREFKLDRLAEIIAGGHLWALSQEYPWAFRETEDPKEVQEVYEILQMWEALEESFDALTSTDRQQLAKEVQFSEGKLRFEGFDGNNERQYGIANFIIKTLGQCDHFEGRALNSHMRSMDRHRRMLSVFKQIDRTSGGRRLSVDQLIEVVAARLHPSRRNK